MDKMWQYTFVAGLASVALAAVVYIVYAFASRRTTVALGAGAGGGVRAISTREGGMPELGGYGTTLAALGFGFLTLSLIARTIATGHGPFANQYEFSVAFAWGIVGVYLYFEQRYRTRSLGTLVMPLTALLLILATAMEKDVQPLVPALQNNLLLTIHVAIAILAYGTFAISCGAAVLYLIQSDSQLDWLPDAELLDEIGYRAVVIGFPAMALVIILGAVWADVAWGSYWSWDPKETASLITWLIYGGYLHARTMRGWRGRRSAMLLIIGFAATLGTFFGNYIFGGLHSYAG
jgi:cytochrome c-type biogenesis protein CcsB